MTFKLEVKDDIVIEDIFLFTKRCRMLFTKFFEYCKENELPFIITSLKSDRDNVRSKSRTHESGRAFDVSIRGWTTDNIDDCLFYFNVNYHNIAAISSSDGRPRAIIHHNTGYGDHLHLQVRPDGT